MKRKLIKRMISVITVTLLFSTTIVYANTGESGYHYTLYQTQTEYSELVVKQNDKDYARVEPMELNGIFRVTVVNSLNKEKSNTRKVSSATVSALLFYEGKVIAGDFVKLKIYNNPADNAGRICSIHGIWIP